MMTICRLPASHCALRVQHAHAPPQPDVDPVPPASPEIDPDAPPPEYDPDIDDPIVLPEGDPPSRTPPAAMRARRARCCGTGVTR
jgi:hypothetical protein